MLVMALQSVVVKYWDEQMMVRYNGEMRQACQKDVTFSDRPCYC